MGHTLPGEHFEWGKVTAGEFTLDYAAAGPSDAPATIVSFPGSAGIEMSVAKDALAQTYRVLEINPPGFGGRDDLHRDTDTAELGGLLAEAANKLVEGPYYLMATSVGGIMALHAAAKHPDRVRGLVLEGSMAPARPEDLKMPAPPKEIMRVIVADAGEGPPAYPLPPVHPNKPWATPEYTTEQITNRVKMFCWVDIDMLPEPVFEAVNQSGVPILALIGDEDEILNQSYADSVATYLPKADFRVLAGGLHDLQNTVAEAFTAVVTEFVGK